MKLRPITIFAIIAVILLSKWAAGLVLRQVFPVFYSELITDYASKGDIDPFLLTAVIRVESKFDPDAVSKKGAVGLMQLMPETADWVSRKMGMTNFDASKLTDPRYNIMFGSWYLSYLIKEFEGRLVPALAAYNGGRGNVSSWLDSGEWSGSFEDVEKIPFPETRNYVKKVTTVHKWYRRIYNRDWNAAIKTIKEAAASVER